MWAKEDILALFLSKVISQAKIRQIVESFESLENYIEMANSLQPKELFNGKIAFHERIEEGHREAQQQLEFAEKEGYEILTFWDREYPLLLKNIQYPPVVLFYKGTLQQPDSISISIVGTRKCTTYGKLMAEKFSQSFAKNNIVVTSGLAYGIDLASHLGAIKANGITYAIIASGLDCITSSQIRKVTDKIIEHNGAIITEHRFGTKALPTYFPQRNRIISGISVATLIIESDIKGGAMITARFAFDQNREVFALPGNINSPKSNGTNSLIKQNIAKIALSPEEILAELGIVGDTIGLETPAERKAVGDEIDQKIFDFITSEPVHIDVVSTELHIDVPELLVRLLNLEFSGFIRQLPGKFYIRS
jgi:DNA processing protein